MGLFDRFNKKSAMPAPKAKSATKKAPTKKAEDGTEEAVVEAKAPVAVGSELSFRMLRAPHVSEKAARLAHAGTYVFDVPVEAEKVAIKKAVESLYKVKVAGVRTVRHAGKPVYRGRRPGARKAWKKALVTLVKGQTIDIYEGV